MRTLFRNHSVFVKRTLPRTSRVDLRSYLAKTGLTRNEFLKKYKIAPTTWDAAIDKKNIYRATQEAMMEIANKAQCDFVLSDAMPLPDIDKPFQAIVKGDQKSLSIAAASIIAKVTRDRLMVQYDSIMPEYGFASNKGYGASVHIEALKKYGPTPIHRASFIKNFI